MTLRLLLTFFVGITCNHAFGQRVPIDYSSCMFGYFPKKVCQGEVVEIKATSANGCQITPRDDLFEFTSQNTSTNTCAFRQSGMAINQSLKWSGDNIISQTAVGDGFISSTIRATPASTTSYTISWEMNSIYPATPCGPARTDTQKFFAVISVEVTPQAAKPTLSASKTVNQYNRETMQLTASGCLSTDTYEWSSPNTLYFTDNFVGQLRNPYDCLTYQVRCVNSVCNNNQWSDQLKASTLFKPTDAGFSEAYSAHLQDRLNESKGLPEYAYRKQFTCIQQKTRESYLRDPTSWAGGFPKYLFDKIATDEPCQSSIDETCLTAGPTTCLFEAGFVKHLGLELVPNFWNYPAQRVRDIDRWTQDHNNFLINAVHPCFNELQKDPLFQTDCGRWGTDVCPWWNILRARVAEFGTITSVVLLRETSKLTTLPMIYWNEANALLQAVGNDINQLRDRIRFKLPNPLGIPDLFSSELEAASAKLVKVPGNSFFLSPGVSYPISIFSKSGNPVAKADNVEYFLSVDPSVATITSSGVLTVHTMPFPTTSERKPLYVIVKHGTEYSVGQFAIQDTDNDGDQLNDSYETAIGLNPTVRNDGLVDQDHDNLLDQYEAVIGTNPLVADTDQDGYSDAFEVKHGSNPRNANSVPQFIRSLSNGLWSAPSTWSCNCVPQAGDLVWIKTGHTVKVDTNTAGLEYILIEGKVTFTNGAKLNIKPL